MLENAKKTILLVEDDAIIALTSKRQLEQYGYMVIHASTGEKAVDATKTKPEIDLILMDINLGSGIDGTQAAEIILKEYDIPIVFVSSHTEPEVVEKTEKITSYGYVVKATGITVLDSSIKMAFKLFDANKVIRKSELKQKALISNISDVIGIIGADGIMKYKSTNIERWFGWKPEDLVGTDGWLTVHPDDLERIQKEFNEILKTDSLSANVEYRYKCKDGSYKMIELTATNLINDPAVNGVLLNYHDITERIKVQEALHESEEKYRLQFLNVNSYNSMYEVVMDEEGKPKDFQFVMVNQAYEKYVGKKASDLIGKTLLEVYPETEQYWIDKMVEAVLSGKQIQLEAFSKEMNLYTEVSLFTPQKGFLAMTTANITERKKAEELLRESEEKYRLLHESAGIGIGYYSLEGIVLSYNNLAAKHMGGVPEDFLGKSIYDLFQKADADEYFNRIQKAASSENPDVYEDTVPLPAGNLYFLSTFTKIMDIEKRLLGIQIISQDITQRRRVENALQEKTEEYEVINEELRSTTEELQAQNEELIITDKALRESEELFKLLFNEAPLGYQSLDIEGNFIEVNQQWLDTLGYSRGEVIGSWFGDFLAPAYRDAFRKRFPIFKAQGHIHSEFEMLHKNGKTLTISFDGKIGHDLNGRFKQTHCILQDISDRKNAEETLVLSEAKYKALFENISDAIFIYDPVSFEILSANKATSEIYGYTNAELIGMSCLNFSAEVEKSKIVATQIKDEGNASVPCRHHKKKDGSDIYVQLTAAKVSVLGHEMLFTVCKDITDRVRMESELKIRQEDLLESQRIAHLGSWRLDIATNKVVWTDELYKMYGFDPALPPPPFNEHKKLFTSESWEILSTALAKTSDSGIPYELELQTIRKDGTDGWMWVYGKTTKDRNGKTIGLMGAAQDITQRKHAEELLAKQNSLLGTLMENLQIGVYMVEVPSGKPLLANEASFKLLGRGIMPEVNASNITKVYALYKSDSNEPYPNDELPLVVAMKGESKHVDDMVVVNPDGTRKMLEVFGSPIKDASNKIWASLVSFQDITNRKLAEEKIKTLLSEKELLLKEVHHRLKNNMNTIGGLLSLQAETVKEPSAALALQDAGSRVRSMSLLYDLLYRSVGFMEIAVKDYLTSLIDEIISNSIYPLKVSVEKNIQDFILDTNQLQPVGIIINELLTNIMKYAFKDRKTGLITVSATSAIGHVTISVQDDGNGIPESISFKNSTGFGLQLVHALTQQLDGTIRIERGNGTRFVLEFEM